MSSIALGGLKKSKSPLFSSNMTFYWYDLETFGLDPRWDRIAQFAGVRTDSSFDTIDDPLAGYCRITPDYIPNIESCLITGITPDITVEKGKREFEFISAIHREFSASQTCVLGYNNLHFDDEFIRNTLYRNFYDPYKREYEQGNSRWDIIDLVRVMHDLRPEGINWPEKEDGRPSFKLEDLAAANGITHDRAHEALSDVYATIGITKLIRAKQPKLFKYVFLHKSKEAVRAQIDLEKKTPFLYTSSVFTGQKGCTTMVVPLAVDPHNERRILVYDLRKDPEPLINMGVDALQRLVFAKQSSLPDDAPKIALHGLRTNRCPVISPISALDDEIAGRIGIDKDRCVKNLGKLMEARAITQKVMSIYDTPLPPTPDDVDFQLYTGGFFSENDSELFATIRESSPEHLVHAEYVFEDPRAKEMLKRFIGRNFPHYADRDFLERWRSFCASRILFPPTESAGSIHDFTNEIAKKRKKPDVTAKELLVLKKLDDYAAFLKKNILNYEE